MQQGKKILLLTSWYPSEYDPFLGNYIRQFASIMSKTNHITVVVLEKNHHQVGKIEVTKVSESFQEIRSFYSASFLNLSKIKASKKVLSHVKLNSPEIEIIHAQVGMTNWWHFLWFKKALDLPLVYSEHGSYFLKENFKKVSLINRLGLMRLLCKSEEITAVSELLKLEMQKSCPKFIHTIGNILPIAWESIPLKKNTNEKYKFLHISTVDQVKNSTGIIEAISLLKAKGILNFSFTFLSDENTDHLKKIAQERDLKNEIQFLGPQNHDNLPQIYSEHDCFVLNSYYETFSIVIAEALFFGLHVISTEVGLLANKDQAPFDRIQKDNPTDLAEKMADAITEKKYSGQAGRHYVKQFSQTEIVSKYAEIYSKLVK